MSMRRSTDRIRTTHTGSLPRPPDMLETLHQLAAGHFIDLAAYESALTRHVADIVKRQVERGLIPSPMANAASRAFSIMSLSGWPVLNRACRKAGCRCPPAQWAWMAATR
jgi:hypothetical protein